MRLLVLLTDSHGGRGGMAKFNRDMLAAFEQDPACDAITVLSRSRPSDLPTEASKVSYRSPWLRSRIGYAMSVAAAVLRRDTDCLVCGHIHLMPLARAAASILRVPLVAVVHGIEAWTPTGRRSVDRVAGTADVLVSVSDFTAARFRAWSGLPGDRLRVIPNCVDVSRYGPASKPEKLLERYGLRGQQVLLTVARMSASERYKGIDEVLASLPILMSENEELAYVIVGDGDDRTRLEAKAASLGIADRVAFVGYVCEEEKADHYRLADAFVMPGRGEGFGIVYLEAMACGVPVVASARDASQEAVRGSPLGIVIDPDRPGDVILGITRALQMGKGPVPEMLDRFSVSSFRRRWRTLIKELEPLSVPRLPHRERDLSPRVRSAR